MTDKLFIYHFFFLILSGVGIYWPPAFGFHLLDMSLRNDQVSNVLKAVTQNGKSILLTALLATVIIYIYSIIGFWYFRDMYDPTEGLDCDTLSQCLLSTFNYG